VERKRPAASDVPPPELALLDGGRPDSDAPLLTRAEARALRRTASLTHAGLRRHLEGVPEPPPRSG
jgi:hypothetical protein